MQVEKLVEIIGSEFFVGIPDSQLKALCDYLMERYGVDKKHHLIAANEGNCTAIAAGYYLSTKKTPVVYLQNSGIGNLLNPVASLLNDKVYGIPMVFIIGWRGEPGIHDEPQHIFQGEITLKLLDILDIDNFIIDKDTNDEELNNVMDNFKEKLNKGKSVAFVVKKDAISYSKKMKYKNDNNMLREDIIKHIVKISESDPIISTTGKTSRELFEIREMNHQDHKYDFLTVGSMGHSSSVALGVAINQSNKKIWCIDGDGAVLMHMGSMAIIGANKPTNLVHIIINNSSHETVGGMPTIADSIDFIGIANACGYPNAVSVDNFDDLTSALQKAKNIDELFLIEVKCAIGARADLGRPTISSIKNKENFMNYILE